VGESAGSWPCALRCFEEPAWASNRRGFSPTSCIAITDRLLNDLLADQLIDLLGEPGIGRLLNGFVVRVEEGLEQENRGDAAGDVHDFSCFIGGERSA